MRERGEQQRSEAITVSLVHPCNRSARAAASTAAIIIVIACKLLLQHWMGGAGVVVAGAGWAGRAAAAEWRVALHTVSCRTTRPSTAALLFPALV